MNSVKLQDTKSIYRNQLFLYTINKLPERETLKIVPFTLASKEKPRNKLNQRDETCTLETISH